MNDARKLVFDRIVAGLVEELESTRAELESTRAELEACRAELDAMDAGWNKHRERAELDARLTAALRAALWGAGER